jgi:hypothetical protein
MKLPRFQNDCSVQRPMLMLITFTEEYPEERALFGQIPRRGNH